MTPFQVICPRVDADSSCTWIPHVLSISYKEGDPISTYLKENRTESEHWICFERGWAPLQWYGPEKFGRSVWKCVQWNSVLWHAAIRSTGNHNRSLNQQSESSLLYFFASREQNVTVLSPLPFSSSLPFWPFFSSHFQLLEYESYRTTERNASSEIRVLMQGIRRGIGEWDG